MVQIQFLENGEILTPATGIPLAITKTVSEIKDLSKRKGVFSKTIVFTGDKNTNKVLGHYYDVNIKDSSFNRKLLNPVRIIQDGNMVLQGNLRLLSINNLSGVNAFDDQISYEAIVYDDTVNLFQKLKGRKVTDLSFAEFQHDNTAEQIVESFAHDYTDGYKYLFGLMDNGEYELKDVNPAIYARQVWDKIINEAGFSYEWDSVDAEDVQFSKLLLPWTGAPVANTIDDVLRFYSSAQETSEQIFAALSSVVSDGYQNSWVNPNASSTGEDYADDYQVEATAELFDEGDNYNPTTSVYTVPTPATGSESYVVNIDINFDFELFHDYTFSSPTGSLRQCQDPGCFDVPNTGYHEWGWEYFIRMIAVKGDGTIIGSGMVPAGKKTATKIEGVTTEVIIDTPTTFTLADGVNFQFQFMTSDVVVGDEVRIIAAVQTTTISSGGNYLPRYGRVVTAGDPPVTTYTPLQIDNRLTINTFGVEIYPNPSAVSFNVPVSLSRYLPKMSQTDFMKSIINIYNLYIDIDPTQPNNLIIKTRDEYYDSGIERDWTSLLCKDLNQEIGFASEESARNKVLTWKTGKGTLNKTYQDTFDEVAGQYTYELDDQNLRDEDKVEISFSPIQIAKNDTIGAFVLGIDGYDAKENPSIVIDGGNQTTLLPFSVVNFFIDGDTTDPSGELNLTEMPYAGHLNDPLTPSLDIFYAFPLELTYTDNVAPTANNMFNLHWRRALNQINDAKVLTAFFNLSDIEFSGVKLNDQIFVHDSLYNIIEISDYNAAAKQPTKVKLIQVDDDVALGGAASPGSGCANCETPNDGFGGDSPGGVYPGLPGRVPYAVNRAPVNDIIREIVKHKNIDLGTNNIVTGKYNLLTADSRNNVVTGNNNIVSCKSSFIAEDNIVAGTDKAIQSDLILPSGDLLNINGDLNVKGTTDVNGDLIVIGDTYLGDLNVDSLIFDDAPRINYMLFGQINVEKTSTSTATIRNIAGTTGGPDFEISTISVTSTRVVFEIEFDKDFVTLPIVTATLMTESSDSTTVERLTVHLSNVTNDTVRFTLVSNSSWSGGSVILSFSAVSA